MDYCRKMQDDRGLTRKISRCVTNTVPESIRNIAKTHGQPVLAITSRLVMLGMIPPE
jgi:hypothetical protein